MSKHTPGPWHVCDGCTHLISDEHLMTVAEARQIVSGNLRTGKTEYVPGHQMQLANSKLIAAAPEMLEALREIANWNPVVSPDEENGMSIIDAINIARAAIAKATGDTDE